MIFEAIKQKPNSACISRLVYSAMKHGLQYIHKKTNDSINSSKDRNQERNKGKS
jgi:hypothetical protein